MTLLKFWLKKRTEDLLACDIVIRLQNEGTQETYQRFVDIAANNERNKMAVLNLV